MKKKFISILKSNRSLSFGIILISIIIILCATAPFWISHDPNSIELNNILQPPVWVDGGTWTHLLGTDQLGRDLLARIVYGGRISLVIGVSALILAFVIGITMGILASFLGFPLNSIIMRIIDLQMAFPYILLALTIMTIAKPSVPNLIMLLALAGWFVPARVVRGCILQEIEKGYVKGAIVLGASKLRIALRYVLPNIMPTILVLSAVQLAAIILFEAILSFLGMGIQPPTPSWGSTMFEGKLYLSMGWWITTLTGFAVFLTALSLYLISEGLKVVFKPRM